MGRHLWNSAGEEQTDVLSSPYGIRPVINLNANIMINGGEGTDESPYTLQIIS